MNDHLSTLTLHQLRYGELSEAEEAVARVHLEACPRCADRLAVQRRERAAFVLQPVPVALRAPHPPSRGASWPWPGLVAGALALAAGLVVLLRPVPPRDEIRLRGAVPPVEVWVDVGAGPRLLVEDEPLGAGDRVQLKFDAAGAAHAAIAGRDQTGAIEVYGAFPTARRRGLVEAPFALELDDVGGVQEFYVVLGDHPLDSATVVEAVRDPTSTPFVEVVPTTVRKASPQED